MVGTDGTVLSVDNHVSTSLQPRLRQTVHTAAATTTTTVTTDHTSRHSPLPVLHDCSSSKSVFSFLHQLETWHYPHLLLWHQSRSARSISPTRRAHSSKPAARCCSGTTGEINRWTERQTPHHYTDPAPHTVCALPVDYTKK